MSEIHCNHAHCSARAEPYRPSTRPCRVISCCVVLFESINGVHKHGGIALIVQGVQARTRSRRGGEPIEMRRGGGEARQVVRCSPTTPAATDDDTRVDASAKYTTSRARRSRRGLRPRRKRHLSQRAAEEAGRVAADDLLCTRGVDASKEECSVGGVAGGVSSRRSKLCSIADPASPCLCGESNSWRATERLPLPFTPAHDDSDSRRTR